MHQDVVGTQRSQLHADFRQARRIRREAGQQGLDVRQPPLLQIGKRHKVACHFPGELGKAPEKPITSRLLGVDDTGSPDPSAGPATDLGNEPGFADTWFDLDRKTMAKA